MAKRSLRAPASKNIKYKLVTCEFLFFLTVIVISFFVLYSKNFINMDDNLIFSSDEEDYLPPANGPRRQALVRERMDLFNMWNETQFFMRFRLRKESVLDLLGKIEHLIRTRTTRNNAIPPLHRLLLTLRFYATGCFLIACGDFIGVSKSASATIVMEVTIAICSLRREYIKMPGPEEIPGVTELFYRMHRFPRVIGVVDGTHIKMQSPGGNEAEVFRNRKQYFSKNVQMVVGPTLKIFDVVTGYAGSVHDQTIFDQSLIAIQFENGVFGNKLLLGDAGYECRPYIVTPLPRVTSPEENLYNESLIRTRVTVERCFGVLKRRFPILSIGIRVSLATMEKADAYIIACAILHNIACINRDGDPPVDPDVQGLQGADFEDEGEEVDEMHVPGVNVNERNERYRVRRHLIDEYFASLQKAGKVLIN
uniref:Nuclease HARBI1 n=3 Tax=Cacopsylla melanoneura TaxID=428564 RepID=A0A8D8RF09_9HEMI